MKKFLSLLLTIVMLLSVTGTALTANADYVEYTTMSTNGSWYEGYMNESNKEDYYKIIVNSDGELTIKVMGYMYQTHFSLFNSDLSTEIGGYYINDGTASSPVTKSYTFSLSKGIYFAEIKKVDNGKYKINSKFNAYNNNETEPNDFENAMYLTPDKTVTGALTVQDEVDWYKINITSACNINVRVSSYMYQTHFSLFNSDLSNEIRGYYINDGTASSPVTKSEAYSLSKGIYYIKISRVSQGKYKLSWNLNVKVSRPNDFRVSARNTTSLKLSWNKVSGVSGYQLQQYKGNKWTTVKNTTPNTYTVSKLKAGTTYKFRVRAYKKISGKNYYSGWAYLTTPTKPATVTLSSVKSTKSKKITVKWKKATCTGYQVQYSTSSKLKKGNKTVTVTKSKTTSKTISKLKGKKKYYVRVRAYKTLDGKKYYGSWSKVKSVTTKK